MVVPVCADGLVSEYAAIGCVPKGPFAAAAGEGKPCKVALRSNNGLAKPSGRTDPGALSETGAFPARGTVIPVPGLTGNGALGTICGFGRGGGADAPGRGGAVGADDPATAGVGGDEPLGATDGVDATGAG